MFNSDWLRRHNPSSGVVGILYCYTMVSPFLVSKFNSSLVSVIRASQPLIRCRLRCVTTHESNWQCWHVTNSQICFTATGFASRAGRIKGRFTAWRIGSQAGVTLLRLQAAMFTYVHQCWKQFTIISLHLTCTPFVPFRT